MALPDVLLQPHSAPLEITFYDRAEFPAGYHGDAFVAFHGSWNRAIVLNQGKPTGEYEDFLTGFVTGDGRVWGRPVGVAIHHQGALLVSEDASGTLWRVSYRRMRGGDSPKFWHFSPPLPRCAARMLHWRRMCLPRVQPMSLE